MRQMNNILGVILSFCMILGIFGVVIIIFFWDEVLAQCCTPYVQLVEESEEGESEEGDHIDNHVELQVISDEDEVQATIVRLQEAVASVSKEESV